jgi:hypothetical protein
VFRSVTAASTTVELGVPGPHDVPGASRARRNSPSPGPGTADVIDAVDDVDVLEVDVPDVGGPDVGVVVVVVVPMVVVGVLVPEPSNP